LSKALAVCSIASGWFGQNGLDLVEQTPLVLSVLS
jgi:hypothetical protein